MYCLFILKNYLHVEVYSIDVLSGIPCLCSATGKDNQYSTLTLKEGCNVMLLIYNISRHLRNGSRGKFIGFECIADSDKDQRLLVEFPKVGTVSIGRQTWCTYDKNGAAN